MRTSRRLLVSSLEALEPRIAPANLTTSFAGGVLKLFSTDPGLPTAVTVNQMNDGTIQVVDQGVGTTQFTAVKSIIVNFGSGDDSFSFNTAPGQAFRGPLTLNLGLGNDTTTINAFMKGALTLNDANSGVAQIGTQAVIAGPIKVTSPGGFLGIAGKVDSISTFKLQDVKLFATGDIKSSLKVNTLGSPFGATHNFTMDEGSIVRGAVVYTGGDGNDNFNLSGSLLGKSLLKMGHGGNTVTSNSTFRAATLSIIGGPGPDSVIMNGVGSDVFYQFNTVVSGALSIALGDGANAVSFSGTRVTGATRITGGINGDTVTINTGFFGSGLTANLGDGTNAFTGVNTFQVGGTLQILGGIGTDTVIIGQMANIMGAARVSLGGGTNSFNFNQGGNVNFDGGFTYTGGLGNDTVFLGGMLIRGAVNLTLGEGTNNVTLASTQVYGKLQVKGGNIGIDTFSVDTQSSLNGDVVLLMGEGANSATFQHLSNIINLTYKGGSGVDGLGIFAGFQGTSGHFTRGKVSLGGGDDSVNFQTPFYAFTIDGGTGTNSITLAAGSIEAGLKLIGFPPII